MTLQPPPARERSFVTTLGALLFLGAILFGALRSPDPLMRVACRLSLTAFVGSWLALRLRPDAKPVRLAVAILAVAAASFLAVAVLTFAWGGGALNGHVTEGHYLLAAHGHERETTAARYYTVAAAETVMFVTWPLVFLLGARLDSHRPYRRQASTQSAQQ